MLIFVKLQNKVGPNVWQRSKSFVLPCITAGCYIHSLPSYMVWTHVILWWSTAEYDVNQQNRSTESVAVPNCPVEPISLSCAAYTRGHSIQAAAAAALSVMRRAVATANNISRHWSIFFRMPHSAMRKLLSIACCSTISFHRMHTSASFIYFINC